MLKVAVIIERAEIALGGAERSTSELTAELRNQGVEATLIAAKGDASENTIILCNDIGGKRTPLKHFENSIREHLRQNHYDIIHSTLPLAIADIYQPRGGSYKEAMLRNIASYPFAPMRMLKRWTHFFNVRRTEYIKAEEKLCRSSHIVIAALSDYVKQQFQQHYQLSDNRIEVIPNAVNTQRQSDEEDASKLKETIFNSISVPNGKTPILFLFAATNPRLKGLWSLLWALKKVTDKDNHLILVITGTNKLGSDYHNIIKQFGLEDHIVLLGKLNGIQHALSICDVAVLPTFYDPCSRFILEALAMGKPVITTRFNGASERYEHLRHGFIIDNPNDTEQIAEAIATFCDPGKIQLAHDAIIADNLKDEVSIQKHVEKLIEVYTTIIANRKS